MAVLAHLGVGLASRQTAPKVPAIIIIIAPLLLDILALIFYLLQLEKTPNAVLSHSLIMTVIWSIAGGFILFLFYRNWRSSMIIGLLILSHWLIDLITCPMSAIFPNSTGIPVFVDTSLIVGLGLYKSIIGAIVFEAGLLILGIIFYVKYKSMVKGKSLTISK